MYASQSHFSVSLHEGFLYNKLFLWVSACLLHLSCIWLHACISCLAQLLFIFRKWGIIAVLVLFTACIHEFLLLLNIRELYFIFTNICTCHFQHFQLCIPIWTTDLGKHYHSLNRACFHHCHILLHNHSPQSTNYTPHKAPIIRLFDFSSGTLPLCNA